MVFGELYPNSRKSEGRRFDPALTSGDVLTRTGPTGHGERRIAESAAGERDLVLAATAAPPTGQPPSHVVGSSRATLPQAMGPALLSMHLPIAPLRWMHCYRNFHRGELCRSGSVAEGLGHIVGEGQVLA